MKLLRRYMVAMLFAALPMSIAAQWEVAGGGSFSLPLGDARDTRLWGSGLDIRPMYEYRPNLLAGLITGLSYYDYAYSLGGDRLGFRIPLMAHLRIYILDARAVPSLYLGIAGGGLLGYTHYYNKASNLKVETPWDSELAWQALAGYSFPVNKRLSGYVEFDYTMRYDRDKALEGTEKFHIIGLHGGIQWHIGRKRPR